MIYQTDATPPDEHVGRIAAFEAAPVLAGGLLYVITPFNQVIALDPVTFKPVAGLSNYIYVDEPFRKDLDYYSLTVNWDAGFADFVVHKNAGKWNFFHSGSRCSPLPFANGRGLLVAP